MEFIKEHEVDRGPIIRWFANKAMNVSSWLIDKSEPYADMYTAVWDEYENDILSTPQNQMGISDSYTESSPYRTRKEIKESLSLPQFDHLTDDLL
jgi:hypothetical protein